ncbi:hypothetical protein DPMN_150604 [Dreissena polymorpha]|uniref:Uncharacterized protein n=1 Tax=Dreissena polymorpha TaxID=45954 RepID=A0A9D4J650_DREPO|nr:hypothetical protein DPMN_150604 [Dreissena polymorpha]
MVPNLGALAQEKRIRGESRIERTLQEGGSKDIKLRKMKKPLQSQLAYETADTGNASVKYEAGIKKETAVLLGDLKGNQRTVIPKTKTSVRSPADVQCRHSSGMSEEVSLKPDDQRGFINVTTCNKTSVLSGLPVKARGRASGKNAHSYGAVCN